MPDQAAAVVAATAEAEHSPAQSLTTSRAPRLAEPATFVALALAALYVAIGLHAMWMAPRVPYADAWRFLAHFLRAPFPNGILDPDNGHHEVLPNLVRVAELHLFAAGQWLQVTVGMVLAVATVVVAVSRITGSQGYSRVAAPLLVVVLGVFWLGNIRALGHGNESVHAYFVTLFLVSGLALLCQDTIDKRAAFGAAVCGFAAAFSFGSGVACFAAFGVLLLLRRAAWPAWMILVAGLLVTLLLQTCSGPLPPVRIAPFSQVDAWLRWLAGPFVYAAWPALDPAIAAQLPLAPLRVATRSVATSYADAFGPVLTARWPQLMIGTAGVGWFSALAWRCRRVADPLALFGLGIAAFGAAAGVLVAVVRIDYFQMHADQLLAPRYLVWSSLFWMGLGLSATRLARRQRIALYVAIAVAIALLPSTAWMSRLGERMTRVADQTAMAAATGVIDPTMPLGETVPTDVEAALPALRDAHAAMFAWPETTWMLRTLTANDAADVAVRSLHVTDVANRIGAPGRAIHFQCDDVVAKRLLLVDADDVVRGMALRERGDAWIGWMQDSAARHTVPRVARLRR